MREIDQFLQQLLPLLFFGGPFVAAVVLALLIPVLLVGAGSMTMRVSPSMRLSCIFILIIVGSTLSAALSGRTLVSDAEMSANPWLHLRDEPSPWGARASQLCTLLVLLLAGAEWVKWLTRRIRMPAGAARLWAAMLVYFLFAVVVSGLFGVFRNPRLNDLYLVTVGTAIALMAEGCDAAMWRRVRWALLLPAMGSLLAIAVAPKLVLLPDFKQSIIPGVTVRLYGLADHANALGVVAAVALALEFSPLVRARPAWWLVLCQGSVLLLTQSKTAILGTALALAIVRWSWLREHVFKGDHRRLVGTAIIVVCVVVILLTLAVAFSGRSDRLVSFLDRVGFFTLTGRTSIWQVTLAEFANSPLTGYGPSLWDIQYRLEYGMLQAGQAHNQFVQILGQAGLLGLLSMLVYLATVASAALRRVADDHGLALGFLLILVVRCMSESPLRMGSLMGWDAWLHLAAFASAAVLAIRQRSLPVVAPRLQPT